MSRFSEKIKIIYLTLVILFAFGVFAYLLDAWGMIRLDQYVPFLKEEPPIVALSSDSASELELDRLNKEELRLKDEELRLQELQAKLEGDRAELEAQMKKLDEMRQGIDDQKRILEEEQKKEINRQKMIREMAERINAMPPNDAVAIVAGWSNTDLVDVFLQMEKNAVANGTPSIVPYLMTKLPRDRAAIITTLMMDEEARLSMVPESQK